MEEYGGVDPLSLALVWDEWSASRPCLFIRGGKSPWYPLVGGWMSPSAGQDDMQNWKFSILQGLELRPSSHYTDCAKIPHTNFIRDFNAKISSNFHELLVRNQKYDDRTWNYPFYCYFFFIVLATAYWYGIEPHQTC
jgi:hypothetical protein